LTVTLINNSAVATSNPTLKLKLMKSRSWMTSMRLKFFLTASCKL
jgi:hypothetical protein